MTQALITEFRANAGQVSHGPFAGRQVLLLTTTGAKSGQERLAPLIYTRDGDRIVIAASRGGAPTHPSWYLNLVASPVVTVELGAEKFQARATQVEEGAERERLYAAHGAYFPGFLDYEKRTTRKIPVITLERLP
jgi:deazaflavin-dependent oxidoreductase (nitroreductase family)